MRRRPLTVRSLAPLLLLALAARAQEAPRIDPAGMTVETRFAPPTGFTRTAAAPGTFPAYLRRLPLKAHGAAVRLFDGRIKPNPGIYAAVVDLPIGDRDLQQCADAVIRLRAEYLFSRGRYDEIRFRFANGFLAEYARWRRGGRIVAGGNSARWLQAARPGDDPRSFRRYLETVFAFAGTASLSRELEAVPGGDPAHPPRGQRPVGPLAGDVYIQGGHPGHAVIVVDVAERGPGGRKVFLLAQSYMPAQEIQVLQNPADSRLNPWYAADFGPRLRTPEWTFRAGDLKRFKEIAAPPLRR